MSTPADSVIELFAARMDETRAWRKKEISELVQALDGTEPGTQLNETLRRALALLLNAHWEAWVKDALDAYLVAAARVGAAEGLDEGISFAALAGEAIYEEAVRREKRRINNRRCEPTPVLHPLADVLMKMEYERGRLWQEVPDRIADRVGLSLWWNRFEYLCGLVDVTVDHDVGDIKLINERVVALRHEIAHGKDTLPDEEGLLEARNRVIELIDALAESLQTSLELRRFAA